MTVYRVKEVWQQALVFDIRIQTFVEGQNIPIELEFDELYNEAYSYILVAENGKGIGTARINFSNEEYAKIERVAVIPEYQNKGIGRQVIEACEKWIGEKGYKKIVITSQTQAAVFYEKIGYEIKPEVQLESTIPIVYTEKIVN